MRSWAEEAAAKKPGGFCVFPGGNGSRFSVFGSDNSPAQPSQFWGAWTPEPPKGERVRDCPRWEFGQSPAPCGALPHQPTSPGAVRRGAETDRLRCEVSRTPFPPSPVIFQPGSFR